MDAPWSYHAPKLLLWLLVEGLLVATAVRTSKGLKYVHDIAQVGGFVGCRGGKNGVRILLRATL